MDSFQDIEIPKRQKKLDIFKDKKIKSFQEDLNFAEQSQDIFCSICYGEISEEKATVDVCQHEYCFSCLQEWLKMSSSCPLCKKDINKIQKFKNGKQLETIKVQKKDLQIESEIDSELLNADNYCYVCNEENNHNILLVCDHCVVKCCHIYCLNPPMEFVPEDEWFCDYCVFQNRLIPTNPIAGIFEQQLNKRRLKSWGNNYRVQRNNRNQNQQQNFIQQEEQQLFLPQENSPQFQERNQLQNSNQNKQKKIKNQSSKEIDKEIGDFLFDLDKRQSEKVLEQKRKEHEQRIERYEIEKQLEEFMNNITQFN